MSLTLSSGARAQSGSVFRLLIAAIAATLLLAFVLNLFGVLTPSILNPDPLEQTRLVLESLQGQRARYMETPVVYFEPGYVLSARQLSKEAAYGQARTVDLQYLNTCYQSQSPPRTPSAACLRDASACALQQCVRYRFAAQDFCFNLGDYEGRGVFSRVPGGGVRLEQDTGLDAKVGVFCEVGERMEVSLKNEIARQLEEKGYAARGIPRLEWVQGGACSCASDGVRNACCLIVLRDPLS